MIRPGRAARFRRRRRRRPRGRPIREAAAALETAEADTIPLRLYGGAAARLPCGPAAVRRLAICEAPRGSRSRTGGLCCRSDPPARARARPGFWPG